jgi:TPR repeat protein
MNSEENSEINGKWEISDNYGFKRTAEIANWSPRSWGADYPGLKKGGNMDHRKITVIMLIVFSVMYNDSQGVTQNSQQDIERYGQAAEQGDVEAQYKLGMMYRDGKGVVQNCNQALEWLTKSAEQGHAKAQYSLGEMYALGWCVQQNYQEAFKWCEKAAKQGHAVAQYELGVVFRKGIGVTQDYQQAFRWTKKAAEKGYPEAQNNLGMMYHDGIGVTQDYKQALEWLTKAVGQGHAKAQYSLGMMYALGQGVQQDFQEVFKWWEKAAEQGVAQAQNGLAGMYYEGKGVIQNSQRAIMWLIKAAEQGYSPAQYNLGRMYHKGEGGVVSSSLNLKWAFKWFKKAAEQGHAKAQLSLALMYTDGKVVSENYVEAYKWAILAANRGEQKAVQFRNSLKPRMSSIQIAEAERLAREFNLRQKQAVGPNDDTQKKYPLINKANTSYQPPQVKSSEQVLPLPYNGQITRYHSSTSIAPFEIKTRSGSGHYYVKLVEWKTKKDTLAVFVHGGRSVEIKVPLGNYELKYAVGKTWYGLDRLFGPKTIYSKADKILVFKQEGNQVLGHSVELYLQMDGNLQTEEIPRSEF